MLEKWALEQVSRGLNPASSASALGETAPQFSVCETVTISCTRRLRSPLRRVGELCQMMIRARKGARSRGRNLPGSSSLLSLTCKIGLEAKTLHCSGGGRGAARKGQAKLWELEEWGERRRVSMRALRE